MSDDPNVVSKLQGTWNNRGWNNRPVDIEIETFKYEGEERYRPKKVTGFLRTVSGPDRDIKVVSLALCTQFAPWSGWKWYEEEATECARDHDKGHLMALSLGGPDHPANCAPMLHGANLSGPWGDLEKTLRNALPGSGPSTLAYKRIQVSVTLVDDIDENDDPRIPARFGVIVTFCDAEPKPIDAKKVTDRAGKEWDNPHSELILQTNPPERTVTLYPKLGELFAIAEKKMGLKAELRGEGACKNKEVPYWVLNAFHKEKWGLWEEAINALGVDVNAKAYLPVNPFPFLKGGGISRAQRLLMLCYNRWKTGGTIQSDAESVLGTHRTFSEHKVEIDHKDPSAKAGDNTYENLQVTSRQYNNKKRDTLSKMPIE